METGKLLTDRVADEIVRSIIGQKLKPGDKLPNEFELAKTLGVGRSTCVKQSKHWSAAVW